MKWSETEDARLRQLWDIHGGRFRAIATIMGRTRGSIDGRSRVLGLQFHGGRGRAIKGGNDAAVYGATTFRRRVVAPDLNVLKPGDNQRKLGRVVTKGKWKGFPIFSLTLEERATCPRTCRMWLSCYGNSMGHAKRYAHGRPLERQIIAELGALQHKYPGGFVVRLHILGDFYSVDYVNLWRVALNEFPALHVFGYSARGWIGNSPDPIGSAVAELRDEQWERFAIRSSGAQTGPRTTVIDQSERTKAIICPAQTGRTTSCATCSLCWATKKPIAFLKH